MFHPDRKKRTYREATTKNYNTRRLVSASVFRIYAKQLQRTTTPPLIRSPQLYPLMKQLQRTTTRSPTVTPPQVAKGSNYKELQRPVCGPAWSSAWAGAKQLQRTTTCPAPRPRQPPSRRGSNYKELQPSSHSLLCFYWHSSSKQLQRTTTQP